MARITSQKMNLQLSLNLVDSNVLLEAINEILGKDIKMLENATNVQKQKLLKKWAKTWWKPTLISMSLLIS
jgi:hypothetical protein